LSQFRIQAFYFAESLGNSIEVVYTSFLVYESLFLTNLGILALGGIVISTVVQLQKKAARVLSKLS